MPPTTRVLIAPLDGVGRDYPLSIEKLCPVLSFYVVKDWQEGCERCKQILRYGGMGHTMSIHSRNDDVILQFGLHKPAYRIVVNTPTTHGSIGLTTGLDPAMTLGCGGYGGNITSDNISPLHLLNIKRLAYEIRPARPAEAASPAAAAPAARPRSPPGSTRSSARAGSVPRRRTDPPPPASEPASAAPARVLQPAVRSRRPPAPPPVPFVCEDDVRRPPRRAGASCSAQELSSPRPPGMPERPCGSSTSRPELPGTGQPRPATGAYRAAIVLPIRFRD